jgi:uncharacterized membrane protein YjgN (DUF898 family)
MRRHFPIGTALDDDTSVDVAPPHVGSRRVLHYLAVVLLVLLVVLSRIVAVVARHLYGVATAADGSVARRCSVALLSVVWRHGAGYVSFAFMLLMSTPWATVFQRSAIASLPGVASASRWRS